MSDAIAEIKNQLNEAKKDYSSFGGWQSLKSGTWLWDLIQQSFAAYSKNASVEYFQQKYKTKDTTKIADKLISVTARNAAILGGVTGAAVTADEVAAIVTGGEALVGLPANTVIAVAAIASEMILMMRFQLQLVANLGKLYGVPLDREDPEDILTILAFALGGSVAEAAGKVNMKVGGKLAGQAAKEFFKKERLAALKSIAAKIGVKVFQKSIVKYTVPIAAIVIGTGWNYVTTKSIAKIATKHLKTRLEELPT